MFSADKDTKIGTVKHVEISKDQENDQSVQDLHSLERLAAPQFWEYVRHDQQWRSRHPAKRATVARVSTDNIASEAGNDDQQVSDDDQSAIIELILQTNVKDTSWRTTEDSTQYYQSASIYFIEADEEADCTRGTILSSDDSQFWQTEDAEFAQICKCGNNPGQKAVRNDEDRPSQAVQDIN